MDTSDTLAALGLTLPTPAYLAGALLFGVIGLVAYYAGKRRQLPLVRWLGVALMLYPYAVADTLTLYAVGVALSAVAWWTAR